MGITIAVQVFGAFAGLLMMFLLLQYSGVKLLKPNQTGMYLDLITGDVYWGRILAQEILLSFIFALIYLIVRFDRSMKSVDRIVKGLAVCLTLTVCLSMSAGSGGCLNPVIGLVSSIFMIGQENRGSSTLGSDDAKYIWVYIVAPFVGAVLAALFFKLHDYIERHDQKQNEPEMFIGLRNSVGHSGTTSAS